jgi:hypothetical protein
MDRLLPSPESIVLTHVRTALLDQGRGYVLVGDASRTGDQTRSQFRLVDPEQEGVPHPTYQVTLFKIQIVNFEGFFPSAISKDRDSTRPGQNLTIAGYGMTSSLSDTPPGEVYETHVESTESYDERFFLLGDPDAADDDPRGPCYGASHST